MWAELSNMVIVGDGGTVDTLLNGGVNGADSNVKNVEVLVSGDKAGDITSLTDLANKGLSLSTGEDGNIHGSIDDARIQDLLWRKVQTDPDLVFRLATLLDPGARLVGEDIFLSDETSISLHPESCGAYATRRNGQNIYLSENSIMDQELISKAEQHPSSCLLAPDLTTLSKTSSSPGAIGDPLNHSASCKSSRSSPACRLRIVSSAYPGATLGNFPMLSMGVIFYFKVVLIIKREDVIEHSCTDVGSD